MRVVFMGNGPFAVPVLDSLASGPHTVALVVARPDRPSGKHRRIEPGPVARRARELGLALEQPESVNDSAFVARLRELGADLLVVADFGQILSSTCLAAVPRGGINAHASLLPKYRGAAPVAWAIYHGESETGVSIIHMTSKMDAGAVLLQEKTEIASRETAGELEARLARLAATLCERALTRIESGSTAPAPQSDILATRAPRLRKEEGKIDWNRSSRQISNQIRAMQPWPIAYADWVSRHSEERLRVQFLAATPVDGGAFREPGAVIGTEGGVLRVATGEGELHIEQVRPAGSRVMDARSFINGHRAGPGDRFI